jgi:hypothetical protein
MMQLIVGDESLQFHFVESKVNPVRVSHSVSYLSGTLTVYAGWIKHLTLGITDISPVHEYKFWNVPLSTFVDLDPDKYYYLYAKCSTSAETGEYILSETPVEIDGVSGYYHLLMGILNSENNSTRRFAQLYGFTEILPGRITTDKIVSQDGQMVIDLINNIITSPTLKISSGGVEKDVEELMTEYEYLKDAIGQDAELTGALFTLVTILLKESMTADVTAGISGQQGASLDAPAFWSGGTYAQAIANTAKTILRHDGSGQLAGGNIGWDDAGNVELSGKITSGGGISTIDDKIKLNSDGSGQLAGGNIEWDADGNTGIKVL